ncbi:hypothetical protein OI18_17745 [Flavihumibacter solisilvae]|uniref:Uncharacterized protein n=2 Tax=Flavihumibacter solisilvae TaxID=1349421 RepID=A0A0C1IT30_9BACT|nr:hypothetical protein OI18_17745 [Flavihumibacter solisilvae]
MLIHYPGLKESPGERFVVIPAFDKGDFDLGIPIHLPMEWQSIGQIRLLRFGDLHEEEMDKLVEQYYWKLVSKAIAILWYDEAFLLAKEMMVNVIRQSNNFEKASLDPQARIFRFYYSGEMPGCENVEAFHIKLKDHPDNDSNWSDRKCLHEVAAIFSGMILETMSSRKHVDLQAIDLVQVPLKRSLINFNQFIQAMNKYNRPANYITTLKRVRSR